MVEEKTSCVIYTGAEVPEAGVAPDPDGSPWLAVPGPSLGGEDAADRGPSEPERDPLVSLVPGVLEPLLPIVQSNKVEVSQNEH